MTWFRVDPNAPLPPSQQIVDALLDGIATGRFATDPKLPSVRTLAVAVLVNPNTVSKAYLELERLGVTRARSGSGVFVTDEGTEIARGLRRTTTGQVFEDAARAALAAGHDLEWLRDRLAELARTNATTTPQSSIDEIDDDTDQPKPVPSDTGSDNDGGQR